MTEELAINIFAFATTSHVFAFGIEFYECEGTDDEIAAFLQSRVEHDHWDAAVGFLEHPMPSVEFTGRMRLSEIQHSILEMFDLPEETPYCITYVIDNAPVIDEVNNEFSKADYEDYLQAYGPADSFDFDQLIEDDFWSGVKVLWNDRKYTSVLKLVFPMIDTLAFVDEAQDAQGAFKRWLENYCDMDWMGVSPDELWELRNSVVHMTNADSRKVHQGKVDRLIPIVAHPMTELPSHMDGSKVFHQGRFVLSVLPMGIKNWIATYRTNPSKFYSFIMAYDTILSDSRYSITPATPQEISFRIVESAERTANLPQEKQNS